MALTTPAKRVMSVSALASAARLLLEERFALVWVEGEISNLRAPGSGHWYFTLKDAKAQIRCAMFASRNRQVRFSPKDGDQVVLRGRISLYEPRGDFQLIGEHLEPAGAGALQAAFEALKAKLDAEGLFATALKRPLPEFPRHIAVISSRTGAALRDVVSVFRRRCPTLAVTLLPVSVQGPSAAKDIVAALARFDDWPEALSARPEAVLLTRGGGSLEDLNAFNVEAVARAIRRCPIPVVSAVGHETDVTIADFAADLRAPTPSAGAELLAPDLDAWASSLSRLSSTLAARMRGRLREHGTHLAHLKRRLVHPGRALQQRMQRLDDVDRRLRRSMGVTQDQHRGALTLLAMRLHRFEPRREIAAAQSNVRDLRRRLNLEVRRSLRRAAEAISHTSRALTTVSPLNTLGRGYAIVTEESSIPGERGTAISRVAQTAAGRIIVARLVDGRLICSVTEVVADAT